MQFLSVQNISQLSGVNPHTLRAWERRYQAITPKRNSSNRRTYSFEDLERVRLLNSLVQSGLAISKIANMSNLDLRKLQSTQLASIENLYKRAEVSKATSSKNHEVPLLPSRLNTSEAYQLKTLLQHLKGYDLNSLNKDLSHARLNHGASEFVLHVATPLFQAVGELVQNGALSISQEHALTALLRNQLAQLIQNLAPLSDPKLPLISLTTREGDHHELGILLAHVLCVNEGFPVVYLGSNLPAQALLETVEALSVKVVILGHTPLPPEFERINLEAFISELKSKSSSDLHLCLGGPLIGTTSEFLAQNNITHFAQLENLLQYLKGIRSQLTEGIKP